jgi:hypothetical protein
MFRVRGLKPRAFYIDHPHPEARPNDVQSGGGGVTMIRPLARPMRGQLRPKGRSALLYLQDL